MTEPSGKKLQPMWLWRLLADAIRTLLALVRTLLALIRYGWALGDV